jgi:hypothetical protein
MTSTPLQARRRRVRLIRRRVVGAATAMFIASTGGILVQLAAGHDPALASTQTTKAHAPNASTSVAAASTGASSTSSGFSSTGSATAVTTRAS